MQEEDTCRICSAPAEPGQPLYHPCKCSGTIRYIHQDCLTTWLAHSKKKSCDVCKFQYSFTKVYSPNMPKHLPFILFLRKFARQLLWGILLGLRAVMVAFIWLAFLPYVTVWTWRFYFVVGDHFAWWVNDRPRPEPPVFYSFYSNVSVAEGQNKATKTNMTLVDMATSYPAWKALSSDIFTGQIIASLIVLAFLGVFLLREWIMQNARPGVFDEELHVGQDGVAEGPPAQLPAAPVPQQEPIQQQPPPLPPLGAVMTTAAMRDAIYPYGGGEKLEDDGKEEEAGPSSGPAHRRRARSLPSPLRRRDSGLDENGLATDADFADPERLPPPRHRRRVTDTRRDHERDRRHQRYYPHFPARTVHAKGKERAVPHLEPSEDASHSSPGGPDDTGPSSSFQFTFSVNLNTSPLSSGSPTTVSTSPGSFSFSAPAESSLHLAYESTAPLPYPIVASSSNGSSPNSSPTGSRRPPMLKIGRQPVFERLNDFTQGASSYPLDSPSLATYRAPEELDGSAGPSTSLSHVGPSRDDKVERSTCDMTASKALAVNTDSGNGAVGDELANLRADEDHYFASPEDSEDDWEELQDVADDGADDEQRHPAVPGDDDVDEDEDGREEAQADIAVGVADIADRPIVQEAAALEEQDPNEGADAGADDDMDGVLEAIGMRGPITTVFQNAALMIFVLDTTIGLGIWLPFTIGKTAALLSQEPYRILQLLHLPIRAIRYVTDPIVDLSFLLIRLMSMPIIRRLWSIAVAVVKIAFSVMALVIGPDLGDPEELTLTKLRGLLKVALEIKEKGLNQLTFKATEQQNNATVLPHFDFPELPYVGNIEQHFAVLGGLVRTSAMSLKNALIDLANGDGSTNRVFAVVLGYVLVGIMVAIYLNVLNVGSVQSAGRAMRSAIRQQLIVLKVATFILIELVVFPLGCGVMLDLCTLRLFPDTVVRTRLVFFKYAPVTATFYHWMIGTMFMYQFAILLAGCRSIMRPGAMWFIKDPQDQNFHPIRDILDRPTVVQLRKLGISAVMYSVVVACGMGSIILIIRLWGRTLLPLRWKLREPLSEIPIDLLFVHIVVPPTLHYFRPRKAVRAVTGYYWRWAARQLRLSSYMFGGRHPAEERSLPWKSSSETYWKGETRENVKVAEFTGSFRRVPAGDTIALPKELRATVAVDYHGNPVDEAGRRLMEAQDAEAERAKRNPKEDYTIVYIPPGFRYRIVLFIVSLWLVFSMLLGTCVALPVHLGRAVFKLALQKEVHDVYSFIVGFYLFWGCYVVSRTVDRMDKRRQRMGGDEPRAEWPVYVFKRSLLWLAKFSWMAFWIGFVIPILIALVMEFYVVLPLRLMLTADTPLRIRIFESWAVGLVYMKMTIGTMRFRPETRVDGAIMRIKQNGWRRPDAWQATTDLIGPVTGGLLGMLLLPFMIVLTCKPLLVLSPAVLNAYCPPRAVLYVYPGIFVAAASVRAFAAVTNMCGSWAQSIRDSEFLVEMRLRNLEPTLSLSPLSAPPLPSAPPESTSSHAASEQ